MHPELLARGVVEGYGAAVQRGVLQLGERLLGHVLLRLGTAFPGTLCVGLRLRAGPGGSLDVEPGDQDLLFSSRAFQRGRGSDYLCTDYDALTSYAVEGVGEVHLRLVGSRPTPLGQSRWERLQTALWDDDARFVLEGRALPGRLYSPLARVRVRELLPVPPGRLQVDAHLAGRGLHPLSRWHA